MIRLGLLARRVLSAPARTTWWRRRNTRPALSTRPARAAAAAARGHRARSTKHEAGRGQNTRPDTSDRSGPSKSISRQDLPGCFHIHCALDKATSTATQSLSRAWLRYGEYSQNGTQVDEMRPDAGRLLQFPRPVLVARSRLVQRQPSCPKDPTNSIPSSSHAQGPPARPPVLPT